MIDRFPKLESPFVREEKQDGYYCVNLMQDGHEWVFNDIENTICCEKLDGTNVAVLFEEGNELQHPGQFQIWARKGQHSMNFYSLLERNNSHIVDGVLRSWRRGWIEKYCGEGRSILYGELIGEKEQGNPYDIDGHLFVPFEYLKDKCSYNSYGKYDVGYEPFKKWFRQGLIPLFYARWHNLSFEEAEEKCDPEGVVFHHESGKMSKLRVDMFDFKEE